MEAIKFNGSNVVIAEDQPEYTPLPAFIDKKDQHGRIVTCWQLSEQELEKIKQTGVLWLSQMTFRTPMQPIFLTVNKEEVIKETPFEDLGFHGTSPN